jgi:hypothetical protein
MTDGTLIDQRARSLAQQVVEARREERDGRWQIAALVQESEVPSRLAYRDARSYGRQAQDDYAEYLREKLVLLVVGPKFDVRRIADGASFSGWMRSICSSAIFKASVREVVQPHNKRVHGPRQRDPILMTSLDESIDVPQRPGDDAWLLAWEDEYHDIAPSVRLRSEQIHLRAEVLTSAYHLRPLGRGVYRNDRDALLARLDDPKSASNDTTRSLGVSPFGLAVLWPDQMEAFSVLPTIVAHALALSSLSPVPPPSGASLIALRAQMGLPPEHASRIMSAFARYHSETYVRRNGRDPLVPKTYAEHVADEAEFRDAVSPLGDPQVVYDNLCAVLRTIERSRFSD